MSFKQYLPSKDFSKRILKILAIILVVILVRFVIYPVVKNFFIKRSVPQNITVKEFVDTDTDGDGLPDWEEEIWGTNPKKVDTDGDGISDFDFVNSKKLGLNTVDVNETVILSGEIMQTLFALLSKGVATNEALENLASATGESIVQPQLSNKYSRDDFKSVTGSMVEVKVYYAGFEKAYTNFAKSKSPDEFDILALAISAEDGAQLVDLDKSILKYKNFEKALLALPVPLEILETHTAFTNTIASIAQALEKSQSLYSNSIIGVNGVVELRLAHNNLDSQIETLRAFFKRNGLVD